MNTMITIGEYTFPFEQAVFHKTNLEDPGTGKKGSGYFITIPEIRQGNYEGHGSQSHQLWVTDPAEIEAIDFYLERHAVNLVQWKAKMKANEHKRNQHP